MGLIQLVFIIGDDIKPGIKLHDVEADAIELMRAGQMQKLHYDVG